VLAEKQQELRLICIDPLANGKVLSSQTLAQTKDKMMQDVARRIQATHLTYGEGMLVAPTNAGAILAVDLLTNRLVWAYPYREKGDTTASAEMPVDPRGRIIRRGGFVQPQFNPAANNQWKVSAPIIQDGKVLFTAPDARSIHCVNLRDGSRVWMLPRGEEDLYLGGVYGGKVLIVGRKSVRGVSLSKGETLWTLETGLPSGQGIASENIYYLPLKEAAQGKEPEICAIDMDKGHIHAHTKSRKREVPGNLIFYEGDVLSQTATEMVAFPQLKVKLAQIDELIAKNPNDPLGLTERGELRLDKGDLAGAIEDLSAALRNSPPEAIVGKAKTKLYETLTELLQRDFNAGEKYIKEYEQLCTIDVASLPESERAEKEKEGRRRRANYLCLVAKGRENQGKLVEAFEKYQEFATLTNTEELISVIDEPTVKTAPDVWSQGRIAAMVHNAKDADRKPLEDKINQKWQELKTNQNLNELRKFVGVFGSLFQVGKEARLQLAERLMEDSDPLSLLDAERHLTLLRGRSEDPKLAARAIEALARLNTRKGWMEDAAYYYELLGKEYAKVPVIDGKTGEDLYNDLATDKRFLPHLDKPSQSNTGGKIKAVDQTGSFPYQHQTYQFGLQGENIPFFQRNQLMLRFDSHHLKLVDRNTNEERWDLPLTKTMFQNLVYGQQGTRFGYQTMGHLVVLPLGHMVYGINPITGKQLWEKNLQAPVNTTGNPPPYNQLIVDPQDNSLQVIYPDGWIQRLGQTGSLEGTVICLQTREALLAIDPLTGRTLWTRSDVSPRSHVFSDAERVYVVDINADNKPTGTRALRAYDGVSVKVPDFTALYQKRVRMLGRNILVSDSDGTGKLVFRLYDVQTGKDLWSATVPQNSTQLRSEEPNLLGVVEPDGKLHVWNLHSQKEVMTSRMDPRHLDKLVSAQLLTDGRDYFVACNGQVDPNLMPFGGVQTNLMAGTGMRAIPVNGMIYSFDGATGKVRWYNKVLNQMLVLDRFEDLPVVLFTARYQRWNQNGPVRNPVQVVSAKGIAKATGKLLYDNENLPNGMNFHALRVDARAGRIEFEGYALKIIFTLNSEAAAAN
jgi:outer membrane protein assembly factor BamB